MLFAAEALGVVVFRPKLARVGVLALDVGVPAREVLPFNCGRFWVDGELERVEEGLRELEGLFNFRTDTGNLEAAVECVCSEMGAGCVSGSRMNVALEFSAATSLRDRT